LEVDESVRERNRKNARRSTGPRSAKGKARSRLNALKFGVTSRALLLPGESPAELESLDAGIRAALAPVGAAETILVDRIVIGEVRRRWIEQAERSVLISECRQRAVERARREPQRLAIDLAAVRLGLGSDGATEEEWQLPGYREALAEEEALARVRDGEDADFGVTYTSSMDVLDRLERHRAAAERSIDRAMHELMRLQEWRQGGDAPVPAAVDVTVGFGGSIDVEDT